MATTLNGPGGLFATQLAEEASGHDQELAPIPCHKTVERTALNLDPLVKLKIAT